MKNLPITIKIVILLLVVGFIFSMCKSVYSGFTSFYNSTVQYSQSYTTTVENQITTFDNNWLAFKEKSSIANINKETFVQVTQIIFSARTDGQNVAWKWVHENQNIPYEEFTVFYKELSAFTQQRFAENNELERQKQQIVKEHNTLIKTFPGVIYNYFLNIKPLVYKKGFVSKDTKELFKE